MTQTSDAHLTRLADHATLALLDRMGFGWTPIDLGACAAAHFKRTTFDAPAFVGFLGGASSGKSTLFNSLFGREVSRISAHAHETLGPIIAAHQSMADHLRAWIDEGKVLPDFETVLCDRDRPTTGQIGAACIHPHEVGALRDVLVFDTPDVTSKMSADEGAITRSLLPWFDGLIVVVDEERWFDAAVFDDTVDCCRNYGPRLWVVFNRTERAEALTAEEQGKLERQAREHHASGYCVSPFQTGFGFRPVAAETREQLTRWLSGMNGHDRSSALESQIQRRCARVVEENVARGDQFTRMCHAVDDELARIAADASLSVDLLTAEERSYLGLGHRYLPLYDTFQSLRRRLSLFGGKKLGGGEVDFEKRTAQLADVLRRNLDMRFSQATDRIDEIVADQGYVDRGGEKTTCAWAPLRFDEHEWAARIRAHIDAWKAESTRQSHAGDVAALSFSAPLLLADILFLGGAGLTLTWAAAWVAGFLGGKGLMRLTQGSPAFNAYQTTVRTYQSFIREALTEQWEANLDAMPRRHMKMTDPVLEAMMYWSTPGRR